jgi:hypothetical protein
MKKVFRWIARIFTSLKSLINRFVVPSVLVVEALQKWVDDPTADILTAIIPGQVDDHVKDLLRKYLPEVLFSLKLSTECVNTQDSKAVVECAAKLLQKMSNVERWDTAHRIAVQLSYYLADGKLTWSEAVLFAEMVHREFSGKK